MLHPMKQGKKVGINRFELWEDVRYRGNIRNSLSVFVPAMRFFRKLREFDQINEEVVRDLQKRPAMKHRDVNNPPMNMCGNLFHQIDERLPLTTTFAHTARVELMQQLRWLDFVIFRTVREGLSSSNNSRP